MTQASLKKLKDQFTMVSIRGTSSAGLDCDKEWELAYLACEQWLSSPNRMKGLTGGCQTIDDCARGWVSAQCRGNPVIY